MATISSGHLSAVIIFKTSDTINVCLPSGYLSCVGQNADSPRVVACYNNKKQGRGGGVTTFLLSFEFPTF